LTFKKEIKEKLSNDFMTCVQHFYKGLVTLENQSNIKKQYLQSFLKSLKKEGLKCSDKNIFHNPENMEEICDYLETQKKPLKTRKFGCWTKIYQMFEAAHISPDSDNEALKQAQQKLDFFFEENCILEYNYLNEETGLVGKPHL